MFKPPGVHPQAIAIYTQKWHLKVNVWLGGDLSPRYLQYNNKYYIYIYFIQTSNEVRFKDEWQATLFKYPVRTAL